MPRVTLFAIALLAFAATGCTTTGEQTLFHRSDVVHPEALFDVASRSAQLRAYNGGTGGRKGDRICMRANDLVDLGTLIGPSLVAVKGGGDTNKNARNFARAVNMQAYYVLFTNDQALAQADIAALRRHAEAGAWLVSNPSWTDSGGAIDAMLSLLPAWHILRQSTVATPSDVATIQAWLAKLAVQADVRPGDNNVGTARGANDMMLGLMLGDRARYERGIQTGFVAQLAAMRPNGSFPRETERGRAALQLQSRNIALLLFSAEIAASQGQNLFGTRVDGKGVDDAIRFLLAASDDNALVDRYAQANVNPPNAYPVFAPMSQVDPVDSTARAWAFLYTERFPRSKLSQEIRAKIPFGSRVFNDTVGGNVTCYAARL